MIGAGDRGHIILRGGWSLVAAAFALGFLYLHFHNQVVETSCRLKAMEANRSELREESGLKQVRLEKLKSPATIKSRIAERSLAMALPREDQIVRVRRDGAGSPPPGTVIVSAAP